MSQSDEQLLCVLAKLEECRAALRQGGKTQTAQMVSLAILDLRMKLHRIDEAELEALCGQMTPSDPADERSHDGGSRRSRPLLRIVK